MRVLLTLFIFLCLVGCNQQPSKNRYRRTSEVKKREARVDAILKDVSIELHQKKGLKPFGSGGRTSHGVEKLNLAFQYYNTVGIEEGRELLLVAIETFVDAVNADKQIRPFLKSFPFEPKNVEIEIYLRNSDGTKPAPENLVILSAIDGILKYEIDDREAKWLRTVYKETYERALERPTDITWVPEPLPDFSKFSESGSKIGIVR